MKSVIRHLFLTTALILWFSDSHADTLHISMVHAEELFLKSNYQILAEEFNIDAQRALEIQAKLYPNPILVSEFNVLDPENRKAFHNGPTGQKSFQLQQLFLLGGKRKSEIELAKSNTKISELIFNDMLRQLRYQLHSIFNSINIQNALLKKYEAQASVLDSIIMTFDVQVEKGNLPLKDLVRLKTLYINLTNQKLDLYKEHYQNISNLQILLQTKSYIKPILEDEESMKYRKTFVEQELLDIAIDHRPDYQIAEQNKSISEQYLEYQRKLAVPDVTVYASYDQRGGAFVNQLNAGVALPLPFFHRNQGNIKSAKINTKVAELNQNHLKISIESEIRNHLNVYVQSLKEYEKVMGLYSNDFDFTLNSISSNFKKRNVDLLEFVDFFEAYNDVIYEIAKSKLQLVEAAELLNYSVSKDLFN